MGKDIKDNTGGMKNKLIKNKAMILIPETHPNSFNKGLLVNANTKNPMAAVMLQNKVTTPILPTIFTKACCLSFVSLYEVWYLFKK